MEVPAREFRVWQGGLRPPSWQGRPRGAMRGPLGRCQPPALALLVRPSIESRTTSGSHAMPYAQGRVIHDADSHLMEPADWLVPFAEGAMKERLMRRDPPSTRPPVTAPKEKVIEGLIAGPKGRLAYGACDPVERTRALDELGFSSQLVFPTSALRPFRTSKDLDVVYAGARAANRAMADFCKDKRLIGVAYVPLDDPGRALEEAQEATRLGCGAVWVPS